MVEKRKKKKKKKKKANPTQLPTGIGHGYRTRGGSLVTEGHNMYYF